MRVFSRDRRRIWSWLPTQCNWDFEVDGDDANIVADQSCAYEVETALGPVDVTEYWSTLTLSLSEDTITVTGNGTVEFQDGSECSTTQNGTLSRVGS